MGEFHAPNSTLRLAVHGAIVVDKDRRDSRLVIAGREAEQCPEHYRRSTCRGCGGTDLMRVLDLGLQPLANAFLSPSQFASERRYPLVLYLCLTCHLAQLLDVVSPQVLFSGYRYETSASIPMVFHFERYAEDAIAPRVKSGDLVVDIGGNDGLLLGFLARRCRVLNVDPAANLGPASHARGVPPFAAEFSSAVAAKIVRECGLAQVITANNVMAHVDHVGDFLAGVQTLLARDGTFIMEVPWVKQMLDDTAFDVIYHEHLSYYFLRAIVAMLDRAGFVVSDVELVETHGQSLRIFAHHRYRSGRPTENCGLLINREEEARTFIEFAHRARAHVHQLRNMLVALKAEGARIVGYGAPAKGNTLLNYCGLGPDLIDYLTDTTPSKQGLYSPGMHIPVVSPDRLRIDKPDYALLLAWNYRDAILEKESDLRANGMRFIVPVPAPEII